MSSTGDDDRHPVISQHELGQQVFNNAVTENSNLKMMHAYYTYLFPYTALIQALECSGPLRYREFSFTKSNNVFTRFVSCRDENGLRETVQRLGAIRIDLGGVYSRPMVERPARPNSETFRCIRRELTFDIDLTDYPPILKTQRTDPADPQFAQSWRFLYVAAVFVSRMLKDNFGFNNVLPVFSGRRGIHIWVNDTRAVNMSTEARCAVLNFLNPFDIKGKVTLETATHPCFQFVGKWIRSGVGKQTFLSMALEQQWFSVNRLAETVFPAIPELETQKEVTTAVLACRLQFAHDHANMMGSTADDSGDEDHMSLTERTWQAIIDTVSKEGSRNTATQDPAVICIVLYLMFPRFDRDVTRGMGHLLKAPFSVHPTTTQICVPFDCNKASEFDSIGSMTLRQIGTAFDAHRQKLLKQVLIFKRALVWPQHSVTMHNPPVAGTSKSAASKMRQRRPTTDSSSTSW